MKELYDITEVCEMLGTTSRTLRFYEEKGIISSTKDKFTNRRKYTSEQFRCLKNVLVLRSLGISVSSIIKFQNNDISLKETIIQKRSEIIASVQTKSKEINLLNEAITMIESGQNVFDINCKEIHSLKFTGYEDVVKICSKAYVDNDCNTLYRYFSETLKEYMPENSIKAMRRDTLSVLGRFIEFGNINTNSNHLNIVFHDLIYENLILRLKYVFNADLISGFWATYLEKIS